MSKYLIIGESSSYKNPEPWIFKPVFALRLKLFLITILIFLFFFVGIIIGYYLYLQSYTIELLLLAEVILILTLIIVLLGINRYYRTFEYQVHGTEIIIKKGLINITENHIPFSNITNIAIRKGPFDQLLGIGSIVIYTAGKI